MQNTSVKAGERDGRKTGNLPLFSSAKVSYLLPCTSQLHFKRKPNEEVSPLH